MQTHRGRLTYTRIAEGITLLALALLAPSCVPPHGPVPGFGSSVAGAFEKTYTRFTIIDGDTFRVRGLARSIRFICLDTEELPHTDSASIVLDSARMHWPDVYWMARKKSRYPVKCASPFGVATAEWTKRWFADVDSVRLEYDAPDGTEDYYGRILAHVIAFKHGRRINYNVACVREGYSPYFVKYGRSRRHHAEFVAAEQAARKERKGIWNPASRCYPDYAEREKWWSARAEAIAAFETDSRLRRDRSIFLLRDGAMDRLRSLEGRQVTVLSEPRRFLTARFPYKVELAHRRDRSVLVIFFRSQMDVFHAVPWTDFEQQLICVRGEVRLFQGEVELHIRSVSDVSLRPLPIDRE